MRRSLFSFVFGVAVFFIGSATALNAQQCSQCPASNTFTISAGCGGCVVVTNAIPPVARAGKCVINGAGNCVPDDPPCSAGQRKKLTILPACAAAGVQGCIREWTNYPAVPAVVSPPRCLPVNPMPGDRFLETAVGKCNSKETKVYAIWGTPGCPPCPPVTAAPTCWLVLESKCDTCR